MTKYVLWLNGDKEQMDVDNIRSRIAPYLGEQVEILRLNCRRDSGTASKRKYIENKCPCYQ